MEEDEDGGVAGGGGVGGIPGEEEALGAGAVVLDVLAEEGEGFAAFPEKGLVGVGEGEVGWGLGG